MAGYTPGPWQHEPRSEVAPNDLQRPWIGRLEEHRYAAMACGMGAEEAWANARLIAAAPELLEACENLLLLVPASKDSPICRLTRAAIAKATGAP